MIPLVPTLRVLSVLALMVAGTQSVGAKTLTVPINKIDDNGVGASIGQISLKDTKKGLRIGFSLTGLPPGAHGFHVHTNPDCSPADNNGKKAAGFAAGSHFDPEKTGKHLGPEASGGHKGDMPLITADKGGNITGAAYAPHLTTADIVGHSIMIHGGGDNYADAPAPLGGGGARIACGVAK